MKVIFFSGLGSSDSDFPLVRALRERGVEVIMYMPISRYYKKGVLFNIDKQPKTGIYPASEFKDLEVYKNYFDLDKLFIINDSNVHQHLLSSRYLWLKVFFHMKRQHADIIHIGWPLQEYAKILYKLNIKIVQMVHDPFVHSDYVGDKKQEKDRELAFKKADKLVLLNEVQKSAFCKHYHRNESDIVINKMGDFNVISSIEVQKPTITGSYILFFGYIHQYKGIEYLCRAMSEINIKHPDVKLVIAGGGKMYFDWSQYARNPNMILLNRYITVPELAGLLEGCIFSVCPYTDATQSGAVQTAFSLNVPLIVTNVGGLPDVVNSVNGGLIIPPCDVDAIADACIKLIENPNSLDEYKKNIQINWHKVMDWTPIAEKYIECYKPLIGE